MNYYLVTAKCGHVGHSKYISVVFPVVASDGKIAASVVRKFPRVKHDHKDAILDVRKVTLDEYDKQREINNNDPYLYATSRKEHKYIEGFEDRLERDNHRDRIKYKKEKCTDYKRRKQEIKCYFYKDDFYDYELAI